MITREEFEEIRNFRMESLKVKIIDFESQEEIVSLVLNSGNEPDMKPFRDLLSKLDKISEDNVDFVRNCYQYLSYKSMHFDQFLIQNKLEKIAN